MENKIIVNGKHCAIVYINDEDGFDDFYIIPEDDPILQKIDKEYEGRFGASFLSNELIKEIRTYPEINCRSICPEESEEENFDDE